MTHSTDSSSPFGSEYRSSDLDGASSVPLHPAARDIMMAALDAGHADPRRLHHSARGARLMLDNARAATAQALGVRPDEVTFTSSGTDAVHRGLLGLVAGARSRAAAQSRPVSILHGAVEHSSVLHSAEWARTVLGATTASAPVTMTGRVVPERWAELVEPADVAALQSANHEVGTRQPVDDVDLPEHTSLFVDACASVGFEPLPRRWDAFAASAHKWGGPAGVGILGVRKRARWRMPFPTDDRIDERSSGFENVPAALAAAAALQAVVAEQAAQDAHARALVDIVRARMAALVDVEVVGEPTDRLAHLVTFSCLYVDGEALVEALDRRGFAVASGSACTALTLRPSHVLAEMGVLTHGNVRISVRPETTLADVERFCAAVEEVLVELRSRIGL